METELYWEKQESGFCAVHCINNVLQGAYFTEQDLAQVALELDEAERALMLESGADSQEYLSYLARDSSNLDDSGNFSVEVIMKTLQSMSLTVVSMRGHEIGADVTNETAFILNGHNHWYAIRKINQQFYNLNSIQERGGPTKIGDFYLSAHLKQMLDDGWSVFCVRGALPRPARALSDGGRGEWIALDAVGKPRQAEFEVEAIVGKRAAAHGTFEYEVKWKGFPSSSNSWEPAGNLRCPELVLAYETRALNGGGSGSGYGGFGGTIGGGGSSSASPSTNVGKRPAPAPVVVIEDDEEEQMRLALAMSLEQELPTIAAEPAEGDADVLKLALRLPDGTNPKRRFRASDTVQTVLDFSAVALNAVAPYRAATTFPRRVLEPASATLGALGVASGSVVVVERA